MQIALIPASFLSAALNTETTILKNENHLYIIREEKSTNDISRLYRLFFGAKENKAVTAIKEESVPSEPDYYSSYE